MCTLVKWTWKSKYVGWKHNGCLSFNAAIILCPKALYLIPKMWAIEQNSSVQSHNDWPWRHRWKFRSSYQAEQKWPINILYCNDHFIWGSTGYCLWWKLRDRPHSETVWELGAGLGNVETIVALWGRQLGFHPHLPSPASPHQRGFVPLA